MLIIKACFCVCVSLVLAGDISQRRNGTFDFTYVHKQTPEERNRKISVLTQKSVTVAQNCFGAAAAYAALAGAATATVCMRLLDSEPFLSCAGHVKCFCRTMYGDIGADLRRNVNYCVSLILYRRTF